MTDVMPILDACCGSKMFWFDKDNPKVMFMDNRVVKENIGLGRELIVKPDIVADFRHMPFADESFYLVVFDPPHLINAGKNSWLAKKYGVLDPITWKSDLQRGFNECMRVLKPHGTLIFKWSEGQIPISEVLKLFSESPLFGDKRSQTRWLVFMKGLKLND